MSDNQHGVEIYTAKIMDHIRNGGTDLIKIGDSVLGKNFSYITIRKWVQKGVFPCVRIGSSYYTTDLVLADWIAAQQDGSEIMSKRPGRKRRPKPLTEVVPPLSVMDETILSEEFTADEIDP